MSTRIFRDFDDLAKTMARMAIVEHVVLSEAVGVASRIVKHNVDQTFGDKTKLAALSEVTMADREAAGYSRNEPLLRDGTLLRDSVQRGHDGLEAGVGSAEPIMVYSENGWVNIKAGTSVPPRPVFKIGLQDSEAPIRAAIDASVEIMLSGKPRLGKP